MLAFPLGVAYFVFLAVGLAAGFGLTIVWIGLPLLALVSPAAGRSPPSSGRWPSICWARRCRR